MGRYASIALILILLPVAAFAAPPTPNMSVAALCRDLPNYQPSADVEYRGDVDAHGRPVVPADIGGTPKMEFPDNVYMSITLDQAEQLGIPYEDSFTPYAYVGEVRVNKSGDVYFNNKRISTPQIQALCADQ